MKKTVGKIGSTVRAGFSISPSIGGLIVSELILNRYITAIGCTDGSRLILGYIAGENPVS